MELSKIAFITREHVNNAFEGAKRFARLERLLAGVCILIPVLLIGFDDWSIRSSISKYYNMEYNQVYYFLLTMAAMLFVVNGVVNDKRLYNIILGVMLSGVILISIDDAFILHAAFAIAFFGGNVVVILKFCSKHDLWFRALIVVGIIQSMLSCFVFKWYSLFWAEWLSLAIIALHYIIELKHREARASEILTT